MYLGFLGIEVREFLSTITVVCCCQSFILSVFQHAFRQGEWKDGGSSIGSRLRQPSKGDSRVKMGRHSNYNKTKQHGNEVFVSIVI